MSIMSKVLATAATVALVGGVGTAGVLGSATAASAATPSCGGTCVNIFGQEFGHHSNPNFILEVLGTVADFYLAGLVSAGLALHYGCVPNVSPGGPTCFGLNKSFNDPAFEIEYTPNGQDSGLCVGVASTATQEEGVTLQECGASSKTVWAVDVYDQPIQSFFLGYYPLINGSDTNFSQPFVLTYPQSGYPTDKPRPQLQVDNLSGYTTGFPPVINYPSIDDNQLWGADFGPYLFES